MGEDDQKAYDVAKDLVEKGVADADAIQQMVKDPSLSNVGKLLIAVGGTALLIPPPAGLIIGSIFSFGGLIANIFAQPAPTVANLLDQLEQRLDKKLNVIDSKLDSLRSVMSAIKDMVGALYVDDHLHATTRAKISEKFIVCHTQSSIAMNATGSQKVIAERNLKNDYKQFYSDVSQAVEGNSVFGSDTLSEVLRVWMDSSSGSPWQAAITYQEFVSHRWQAWHMMSTHSYYDYITTKQPSNPHAERDLELLDKNFKAYEKVAKDGVHWTGTDLKYGGVLQGKSLTFPFDDIVHMSGPKLAKCIGKDATFARDLSKAKDAKCKSRAVMKVVRSQNAAYIASKCGRAGSYLVNEVRKYATLQRPIESFFLLDDNSFYSVSDCNPGTYKFMSSGWWHYNVWGTPTMYANVHRLEETRSSGGAIVVTKSHSVGADVNQGKVYGIDKSHPSGSYFEQLFVEMPVARKPITGDGYGGAIVWGGRSGIKLWHYTPQTWGGGPTQDWGSFFNTKDNTLYMMASDDAGGALCYSDKGVFHVTETNHDTPDHWGDRACMSDTIDGWHVVQRMVEDGSGGVFLIDVTCDKKLVAQRWASGKMMWSHPTPKGISIKALAPVIPAGKEPNKFYALSLNGILHLVEETNGQLSATKLSDGWTDDLCGSWMQSDNNGGVFVTCTKTLWRVSSETPKGEQWKQQ